MAQTTIKLAQLQLSDKNARPAADEMLKLDELEAEIEANGLFQRLLIAPVRGSRGKYEVIDGGRRLRVLKRLADKGHIDPATYDVPHFIIKGDEATLSETSLRIFFHTMALTPAQECRAFERSLDENSDLDAVARRFGVTRRYIEGRLQLAKLAAPIFEALENGKLTLDMAKAYASTAVHTTQLRMWDTYKDLPNYTADSIRRLIATDAMRANDPVALLVGSKAYEAAGGVIDRDFFNDDGDRWLQPDTARALAAAIMENEAERIGAERGLAWIRPVVGATTWDVTRNLHRVTLPLQPMTDEETGRIAEIEDRMSLLHDAMQDEAITIEAASAAEMEMDPLGRELDAIKTRQPVIPPELANRIGALLTLSQDGKMVLDDSYYSETPITVTVVEPEPVHPDLDRAHDGEAGDHTRTTPSVTTGSDETSDGDASVTAKDGTETIAQPVYRIEEGQAKPTATSEKPVDPQHAGEDGKQLSQILIDQLAMQRRDILAASLIGNPALALDYVLFAMVDARLHTAEGTGSTIQAPAPQDPVAQANMPSSRASDFLSEVYDQLNVAWSASDNQVQRFEAFRALSDEDKTAWLAYIAATSLEAKLHFRSNDKNPLHGRLATILDIDVASWWRPTSENYFDRVSKPAVLTLLHNVGGPALAGRHESEKKQILSPNCEKLFAGETIVEAEVKEAALRWVPRAMHFYDPVANASEPDEQFDLAALIGAGDDTDSASDPAHDADLDDLSELIGTEDDNDIDGHDDELAAIDCQAAA